MGGYSLSPVYRQPNRNQNEIPTIEAYRAVNHVRVRADDLDRVGGLIDASINAGANRITGLTFEAKDPEPARLGGQGQIRGRNGGGSDGCRPRDAARGPDQRRSWGNASQADVQDHGNDPGGGPDAGRAGRASRARKRHDPLPVVGAVTGSPEVWPA